MVDVRVVIRLCVRINRVILALERGARRDGFLLNEVHVVVSLPQLLLSRKFVLLGRLLVVGRGMLTRDLRIVVRAIREVRVGGPLVVDFLWPFLGVVLLFDMAVMFVDHDGGHSRDGYRQLGEHFY